ncbi:hypothetical protein C8J56DRAFT_921388 [Mycena floridula]|nr:hypothetical protein C8J56DRAFT_980000 [Mycena floridula]KAJ7597913.1 hypothetical protein C8J56DRAFT_921388 [Mycena floridula]
MISGLLLLLVPAIGGLSSLQAAICCWILIHRPVFLPSLSLYLGMNINRSRRKVQPPLLVYLHLQSPPSRFLSSNAPNECPKLQCYHCCSSLVTTIYP